MKKYFYFFGLTIIVLLTSSCSDTGVVEKPENLIEEERMEQIIYDLLMLDAMNTFNPKNPDFEAVYGTPYLYKKYGIDSLQLADSDAYYAKFPRIYYRMYATVMKKMQRVKDSLGELDKKQEYQ
jgi:hypothetical protein